MTTPHSDLINGLSMAVRRKGMVATSESVLVQAASLSETWVHPLDS